MVQQMVRVSWCAMAKEVDFPLIYQWQGQWRQTHLHLMPWQKLARGEFVLSLDSDDEFTPDALERYKYHWDNLTPEQRSQIGCMMCLVKDQHGNVVGESFPINKEIADFWELYLARHVQGRKGSGIGH